VKVHIAGRIYYQNQQPKILRLDAVKTADQAIKLQ